MPLLASAVRAAGVLILSLAALTACTRSEWQELAISEGGFSVLMRGQPQYVRQQVDTPGGKTYAHLYSSDRPDAFYAVGYSDYPLAFVLSSKPEELLGGVRDTWVRRVKGTLVMSSPTRIDGKYPGIEFSAEGRVKDADTYLQARLYLVDQRLYQVIAMGKKGEVAQGTLNRFLNSFRLIPAGEAMINITPPSDAQ